MLDTTLQARLLALGMPARLAHKVTRDMRDVFVPAAHVAVLARRGRGPLRGLGCMEGCGCSSGMGALGIGQSQAKTAELATSGAKVGSAFPVVGTAVGAAVGVAIAAAIHAFGNHDVRVNPNDMNMCAGMLKQYVDTANQAQGAPIGTQLGIDNLEKINWCIAALYGKPVNNVDYRFFPIGWQQTNQVAQQIATLAFKAPAGGTINIPAITGYTTDKKHSNTRPATTMKLPNPLTLQGLASLITPYMIASCSDGNKSAGNCPAFWNNPYAQRILYDLMGYWVQKLHPEVFAPPKAPVTPAVTKAAATVVATATGKPVATGAGTAKPATTPTGSPIIVPPAVAANPAAAAVYTQLAAQGVDMTSPQAQQIVADAATEGVTPTAGGPAPQKASFGTIGTVLLVLVGGSMLLKGKH